MMIKCNCDKVNAMAFSCWDCNTCTLCNDEYYMVDNGVWEVATEDFGGHGMLCIGCLEARLGGKLVASDFPDYPINKGVFPQSTRLQNRLTNGAIAANF
jgi:hypothetical protein